MTLLVDLLIKHEGLRLKPYRDTQGKLTIGVGRNLDDVGISPGEAYHMLNNDIARAEDAAKQFLWYRSLTAGRQNVVISMIFNMGIGGFKTFERTILAISLGDYQLAAAEMLDSEWHRQVGKRAVELAQIMRDG